MAYLINKARVKQRSAIIALLDLQNAFGEVQKFILACIIVSQPSTNYLRARIIFELLRYGYDRKFKTKIMVMMIIIMMMIIMVILLTMMIMMVMIVIRGSRKLLSYDDDNNDVRKGRS